MSSTMASSPTARLSGSELDADYSLGDGGTTTAASSSPASHSDTVGLKSCFQVHGEESHEVSGKFDASESGGDQSTPPEDLQTRLSRLDILLQKSTVYSRIWGERMNKARRDYKAAEDATEIITPEIPNAKGEAHEGPGKTSESRDVESNAKAGTKRGRYENADEGLHDTEGPISLKRLKVDDGAISPGTSEQCLFKQPDAITGATLKDYQLIGVAWLASLWENGVNGILADEMGLGKTLQTIAFLAYVRERAANNVLIVCPLSVLHNWADEFEKFAPTIPVCIYHGTPAERAEIRTTRMGSAGRNDSLKKSTPHKSIFDTRYGSVSPRPVVAPKERKQKVSSNARGRHGKQTSRLPSRRSKRRLVTQINYRESDDSGAQEDSKSASAFEDDGEGGNSPTHFSGTQKAQTKDPLSDMDGLEFNSAFPIVLTTYEMIIKDRQHLAKYQWNFIIVDEGHRLKNMDCKLMQEIKKYDSANRLILTGTPLHNNLAELWSLLNFILPDIFQDLDSFQQWFNLPMLQSTLADGQSNSIVSKLHGILKPFLLRRLKADVDHSLPPKKEYVLYAPLSERQRDIYAAVLNGVLRGYLINDKQSDQTNINKPQQADAGRHMRRKRNNNYNVDGDDDEWFDSLDKGKGVPQAGQEENLDTVRQFQYKNTVKQVNSMKLQNTVMQLRKVCSHPFLFHWPLDSATREPVVDGQLVNASGKMMILDRLLDELFRRGHKVLLFSQFTTMLDIIEEWAFSFKHWPTCRIDGTTSPWDRRAEMRRFQESGDDAQAPRLFLLSTRAGGLGINLTAADTVIFYDQDWNPQIDLQAMDRAHRIGQTKPVLVFKLVSAHTVETKIMQKANEKRKLEALVIAKGKFRMPGSTSRSKGATVADMAASLLKLEGEKIEVVSSSEAGRAQVISDADLEKLLDRSSEVFSGRGQGWKSGSKSTGDTEQGVAFEVFHTLPDDCNDGLAAIMGEKLE